MAGSNTGKTTAKYSPPTDNRIPPERRSAYDNRNEIPADKFALFETIFSEGNNTNDDDDDDDEDDDYFPENPSGSVLQPVSNPYNKERRIVEANEALLLEPLYNKSPAKVTFSKIERRYTYASEDEYETDSLTSSDTSSVFVGESRVSHVPRQHMSSLHEGIISSDLLLVLVKAECASGNEEFESEDMCVGIYRKANEIDGNSSSHGCEEGCTQREDRNQTRQETRQKIESENKGGINCDEFLQEIIECENELTDNHDNICKESASGITIKITNFDSFNSNSDLEKSGKLNVYIPLSNTDCNYEFFEECTLPFKSDAGNENNTNDIEEEVEEEHFEEENVFVHRDDLENKEQNKHKTEQQHMKQEEIIEKKNNQAICEPNHKPEIEKKECDIKGKKEPKSKQEQSITVQKHSTNLKVSKHHKKVSENDKLVGEKMNLDLNKKETAGDNIKARISVYSKSFDKKIINLNQKIMTASDKISDNAQEKGQSKSTLFKNKSKLCDKSNSEIKNEIYCSSNKKFNRPKSCIEKKSMPISSSVSSRPFTAPARRVCCQWGQPRLPEYNGFRSEYGLSAEQLQERKRIRKEVMKEKHEHKVQKRIEEEQKRKENEAKFCAWLEGKQQQAKLRYIRNQQIKAASSQPYYAPTGHLYAEKKKIGVFPRPKKPLKAETMCYLSLDQLLNSAKNGERKTYRIYLGLPVE